MIVRRTSDEIVYVIVWLPLEMGPDVRMIARCLSGSVDQKRLTNVSSQQTRSEQIAKTTSLYRVASFANFWNWDSSEWVFLFFENAL